MLPGSNTDELSENDPSISTTCFVVSSQFELMSLSFLHEIVSHVKPSGSPIDHPVQPCLFKEVFNTPDSKLQFGKWDSASKL